MSDGRAAAARRVLGEALGLGRPLAEGELRDAAQFRPAGVSARDWLSAGDGGRVRMMLEAATVSMDCGPEIAVAPGAGARVTERRVELVPGSVERFRDVGFAGRIGLRGADVFDRMQLDAERRQVAVPFSAGQVAVARRYRAAVERMQAGGVRCSDLERSGGGGGSAGISEAQLAVSAEVRALRLRVGGGVALRPVRGGEARAVSVMRLVDLVCVQDLTLSQVLRRHRWAPRGAARKRLREALCAALDRMRCFGG